MATVGTYDEGTPTKRKRSYYWKDKSGKWHYKPSARGIGAGKRLAEQKEAIKEGAVKAAGVGGGHADATPEQKKELKQGAKQEFLKRRRKLLRARYGADFRVQLAGGKEQLKDIQATQATLKKSREARGAVTAKLKAAKSLGEGEEGSLTAEQMAALKERRAAIRERIQQGKKEIAPYKEKMQRKAEQQATAMQQGRTKPSGYVAGTPFAGTARGSKMYHRAKARMQAKKRYR